MPGAQALQQISADSPLSPEQLQHIGQLTQGMSAFQLTWTSGYLAGLGAAQGGQLTATPAATASASFTILYASAGGNARAVAEQLAANARSAGLEPVLKDVADYKPRDIAKEKLLALVVSTQGEGEVPESAYELFKYLNGNRAPKLNELQFAVFGLGDSSYEFFCKAGKDFAERFEALGATSFVARVDADVDYETAATEWQELAVVEAKKLLPENSHSSVVPLSLVSNASSYSKQNPLQATVLENRRLTSADAISIVHHLVFENTDGALSYQAGDALGLWFNNDAALIERILSELKLDGSSRVNVAKTDLSLTEALSSKLEITQLHPRLLNAWAELSNNSELQALNSHREAQLAYINSHQLIDLVRDYPATVSAEQLAGALLPLQPRLYSIASSPAEHDDEIHLTVALQHNDVNGEQRVGGASGFLLERLEEGDEVGIYIVPNNSFRLPQDNSTPVILIGAGTGIAPLRAFLQQRRAEQATGKNWLVTGHRHFHQDFLYQVDWLSLREAGLLNKVTPAFSRDEHSPAYVQDRLREQGEDLYQWIQDGAAIYICGNPRMADEVQHTVHDVLVAHGGLSEEAASDYIETLRSSGRLQKDVY